MVEQIETQGGSLRLFVSRSEKVHESVIETLSKEQGSDMLSIGSLRAFSLSIELRKTRLLGLLRQLRREGATIYGYGAPGKAATLLNYYGIDSGLLDCLIDLSPTKQGKYFPNTGLKVCSLDHLSVHIPDYLMIVVWNYADAIMNSLSSLREKGMRFILIYPEPRIV